MQTNESDVGFSDIAPIVMQTGGGNWVHVETPAGSLAIFSSGGGDGTYASYFGFDSTGKIAALVTDFQIVNWSQSQG